MRRSTSIRRDVGFVLAVTPFLVVGLSALDFEAQLAIGVLSAVVAALIILYARTPPDPAPPPPAAVLAHPSSSRALADTVDSIVDDGIARLEALANAPPALPPARELDDELDAMLAVENYDSGLDELSQALADDDEEAR